MKIDVLKPLIGIDNKPMVEGEAEVTFRAVSVAALNSPLRDDDKLTGQAKAELFFLAKKIQNQGVPDLTVEECATIKERVGKAFAQSVVGPFYELIEAGNK